MKTKLNELILNEFVKNGYANRDGVRVWDISDRRFLYFTKDLAKGFLKLRKFKPYKKQVLNREVKLIKRLMGEVSNGLNNESFNLIDVFCGDGKKASAFIKSLDNNSNVKYCPVNVGSYLVDLAVKNVKRKKFKNIKDIKSCVCYCDSYDFAKFANSVRDKKYKRNVFLILGSVLASYQINDYLYGLSHNMKKGDYVIIGNGIRVGQRLVSLEKYKNKIWDAWFFNLMKEIGFEKGDLEYDVRFGNSRIEMFYRVKNQKKIKC